MKIPSVLKTQAGGYLVLGVVGVVGLYVVFKYILPKLTGTVTQGAGQAVGNALSGLNQGLGNNDLTSSATDFAGNAVNYSGHGVVSTLGAETNALSGGTLASLGTWLGGLLPGSGNDYDPNATPSAVNRNQVVTPNYVTDLSQSTGGW